MDFRGSAEDFEDSEIYSPVPVQFSMKGSARGTLLIHALGVGVPSALFARAARRSPTYSSPLR